MRNVLTALITLSFCSILYAQPAAKPVVVYESANPGTQVRQPVDTATSRSNMLAKTGGMLMSSEEGPSVLFLNTQTCVSSQAIAETTMQIQRFMRLPSILINKSSDDPTKSALNALADTNTASVIVIAHVPGSAALLVAPEERWAQVNVAALGGDGVSPERLVERTQKEVWRAIGFLMGAAYSTSPKCLLKPVFQPADLDALASKTLCPEPFVKISACAKKLGMKPSRLTTYRKAVEEGWAPAPTNNFQRAIWLELKK